MKGITTLWTILIIAIGTGGTILVVVFIEAFSGKKILEMADKDLYSPDSQKIKMLEHGENNPKSPTYEIEKITSELSLEANPISNETVNNTCSLENVEVSGCITEETKLLDDIVLDKTESNRILNKAPEKSKLVDIKDIRPVEKKETSKLVEKKETPKPVENHKLVDIKEMSKLVEKKETPKPVEKKETPKPVDIKETPKPVDIKETPKPVDIKETPKPVDIKDILPVDIKNTLTPEEKDISKTAKEIMAYKMTPSLFYELYGPKPVEEKESLKQIDDFKEFYRQVDTKETPKPVEKKSIPKTAEERMGCKIQPPLFYEHDDDSRWKDTLFPILNKGPMNKDPMNNNIIKETRERLLPIFHGKSKYTLKTLEEMNTPNPTLSKDPLKTLEEINTPNPTLNNDPPKPVEKKNTIIRTLSNDPPKPVEKKNTPNPTLSNDPPKPVKKKNPINFMMDRNIMNNTIKPPQEKNKDPPKPAENNPLGFWGDGDDTSPIARSPGFKKIKSAFDTANVIFFPPVADILKKIVPPPPKPAKNNSPEYLDLLECAKSVALNISAIPSVIKNQEEKMRKEIERRKEIIRLEEERKEERRRERKRRKEIIRLEEERKEEERKEEERKEEERKEEERKEEERKKERARLEEYVAAMCRAKELEEKNRREGKGHQSPWYRNT